MAWIQYVLTAYDLIRPVLDVAILAFLLFKGFELLVKTQALQLVKGAGFLALIYGVAYLFRLTTLQWVLKYLLFGWLWMPLVTYDGRFLLPNGGQLGEIWQGIRENPLRSVLGLLALPVLLPLTLLLLPMQIMLSLLLNGYYY